MSVIALDLGGTKLASAVFSEDGKALYSGRQELGDTQGWQVGLIMAQQLQRMLADEQHAGRVVQGIGVAIPGISYQAKGTVWAPNIPGWQDYPLLAELQQVAGKIPVTIDNDRACSIHGEQWQGNARSCTDVVFMVVGTGIGAGILAGGNLIRGVHDIAGAVGWMALERPYSDCFKEHGCFENSASGHGIARVARSLLKEKTTTSVLRNKPIDAIRAADVFAAWREGDEIANEVFRICVEFWGMAAANLVSIFNPQKVLFGGGVFGPATELIPEIRREAHKWGQPVSMRHVEIEASALGAEAALYGAGALALQHKIINP